MKTNIHFIATYACLDINTNKLLLKLFTSSVLINQQCMTLTLMPPQP